MRSTPCSRAALATAAALAMLAATVPVVAQPRFDFQRTQTVLPKTVVPQQVQLTLELDPAKPTFAGAVTMQLQSSAPVAAIVLHAQDLQADSVMLTTPPAPGQEAAAPRVLQVEADARASMWRLRPADGQPIPAGAHTLAIHYRGQVQVSGQGLYRAAYRVQGQPAEMLATQLEAVHARRLLPSFDEPVFRMVFTLTVRAPAGLQVLSNTPVVRAQPVPGAGGLVEHQFAPTPRMQTYLLAVTVGRFDVLEDRSGDIPLRIFTVPGKRAQAQFAMTATQQVLPLFARYFGVPYALPKLDQVAVPGTRKGAMEDWGLISYTEGALLFDPARSSPATQRRVFGIVAHEVAHQWFGNLVSAASWDEIWLNEAFATWMEHKASDALHPQWQGALRVRAELNNTLARDATSATRAIRSGPVSEDAVADVFDGITYGKGGAVLTMLEQWIGPEAFQRGLASYMDERAFKPATAGDLWFHIGRAAGRPVAAVAASWTDQPGVPRVQVAARCSGGQTLVTLTQSRFATDEALPAATWKIPVQLRLGAQQRTVLLQGRQAQARLDGCDTGPLLANAGGRGYYIVDYDAGLWARATGGLAELSASDRVALLSDSFALARAGRRSMAAHFALLAALPGVPAAERQSVLTLAGAQLRSLTQAFQGSAAEAPLRAAGVALLAPELDRLGWDPAAGEDSETTLLRATLIERLAELGHAPTLAAARERLAAALDAAPGSGQPAGSAPGVGVSVPRSIRAAVVYAAARQADQAQFDRLMDRLRSTESSEERWMLALAVTAGEDPVRAQQVLQESMSGRLPPELSTSLPSLVGGRQPALSALAYAFSLKHWAALQALADDGPFGGRQALLPGPVNGSNDPALARRMQADQARLLGAAGAAPAQRAVVGVLSRQRLRNRDTAELAAALQGWAPQRAP